VRGDPVAVDMRRTCENVGRMSKMIQIRNVPDDVHRRLRIRAAREGVTLSELLAREARRLSEQPGLEELRERLLSRRHPRLSVSPAQVIREERDGR
jgi:plasmid stability protein